MRVIAGEFRSRKLLSLPGLETRPTPDRLRETLFSILQDKIEDCVFVDAYAGTGAVGIEALSRGARHVIFIENSKAAFEIIRQNVDSLKAARRTTLLKCAAPRCEKELGAADIVFADPPYTREREYDALFDTLGKVTPPLSIVQHSVRFSLEAQYGAITRTRTMKQGENALSFYSSPSKHSAQPATES